MDTQRANTLHLLLYRAAEEIARKEGATWRVRRAGGQIREAGCVLKIEFWDTAAKAEVEVKTSKFASSMFNLESEGFYRSEKYRLIDYVPRRPKYPFEVQRIADGKRFKFGRLLAQQVFAKKQEVKQTV